MLANLVRSMTKRAAPLSMDDWANFFKFGNVLYPITTMGSNVGGEPSQTFSGYAQGLLYANPAVFTCIFIRSAVFSEPELKWQRLSTGELFGDQSLLRLEQPEPGKTTSDLLSIAEIFNSLGGNWYGYATRNGVKTMRPDWVETVFGSNTPPDGDGKISPWDLDIEIVGYRYTPGGMGHRSVMIDDPSRVAHYMPIPDPLAPWKGMSWLTPLIREVTGDQSAAQYKLKFFEQGGTPNLIIKPPQDMEFEEAKKWKEEFGNAYDSGIASAYKYLYIGGGADATPVGSDMQQMDFRSLQGLSETRIAAAAGLGAVVAQFSEGMQGSSLNAGNYGAARRRVADGTFRPLWRKWMGAAQRIVEPPAGTRLWYDDKRVPFLQEDAKDDADILARLSQAVRQLVDAGYEPDAVIRAIAPDQLRPLLNQHTGLFSVQLQPPSDGTNPQAATPAPRPRATQPALQFPAVNVSDDEFTLEDEFKTAGLL
jgi:hypothetical protein